MHSSTATFRWRLILRVQHHDLSHSVRTAHGAHPLCPRQRHVCAAVGPQTWRGARYTAVVLGQQWSDRVAVCLRRAPRARGADHVGMPRSGHSERSWADGVLQLLREGWRKGRGRRQEACWGGGGHALRFGRLGARSMYIHPSGFRIASSSGIGKPRISDRLRESPGNDTGPRTGGDGGGGLRLGSLPLTNGGRRPPFGG